MNFMKEIFSKTQFSAKNILTDSLGSEHLEDVINKFSKTVTSTNFLSVFSGSKILNF